jgi:hypothetical protein
MKTVFKVFLLSLLFVGCKQKITPQDVSKLNGYWEIEKVEISDGDDKDYKINEHFDYFEIKDNQGFRKKVQPQLDGTFIVNDTEDVKIRFEKDQVFVDYSTDFAKWTEELLTITETEMVVKNADDKEYHYKKTGPINITGNGKKTE